MALLPAPVGILGGTFDPIHYGHLRFAEDARAALELTEVRLIPSGTPPHREPPLASALDRLAMARAAAADFPGIAVDDREVKRDGPSYTVVTLQSLRRELHATPLCLLLGADALSGLPGWFRWRELFALAHLVAVGRPGAAPLKLPDALAQEWSTRRAYSVEELRKTGTGRTFDLTIRPHRVSGTDLRARLVRGERPSDLLPPSVLAYIDSHRLYRTLSHSTDAP